MLAVNAAGHLPLCRLRHDLSHPDGVSACRRARSAPWPRSRPDRSRLHQRLDGSDRRDVLANNTSTMPSTPRPTTCPPTTRTERRPARRIPDGYFGFAVGTGGALTPPRQPVQGRRQAERAGRRSHDRFVYVTDFASNELIGYGIQIGRYSKLPHQRAVQDRQRADPVAIDPRGIFIYVANALDSSISALRH